MFLNKNPIKLKKVFIQGDSPATGLGHHLHWIGHWPLSTQDYCEQHLFLRLTKYLLPLGQ